MSPVSPAALGVELSALQYQVNLQTFHCVSGSGSDTVAVTHSSTIFSNNATNTHCCTRDCRRSRSGSGRVTRLVSETKERCGDTGRDNFLGFKINLKSEVRT